MGKMQNLNHIILSGKVLSISPNSYTPSGVLIQRFFLEHDSQQFDSGVKRKVNCKLLCLLLNTKLSDKNIVIGSHVTIEGFISMNSKEQIVLNIQNLNVIS